MENMNLLIVLTLSPEPGQIKSRLAKVLGATRALEVYIELQTHVFNITNSLYCEKAVFYSNFVSEDDMWERASYEQYLQRGDDHGERMLNAFKTGFKRRFDKVVAISCDSFDLNSLIIKDAFDSLNNVDVVLGPLTDGGYYLIGMKDLQEDLFKNKEWDTENVFLDTLLDLQKLNLSSKILETLQSEVESEEDSPSGVGNDQSIK